MTAIIDAADMASLSDPIRLRLVAQIVEEARSERGIPETLAMLDVAGLTGDRAALAMALEATDDPSYVAAIATLATPRGLS